MDRTKLLAVLGALVLLINYINYAQTDKSKILKKAQSIEARIQHERQIAQQYREDPKSFAMSQEENLSRYFYAEQDDASLAMADAGQRLKALLKRHELKLDKLTWGEPYSLADTWYTVLPFSLRFTGYPADFVGFYDDLVTTGKLLHVTSFTARRDNKRKIVKFELGIAGYKAGQVSHD